MSYERDHFYGGGTEPDDLPEVPDENELTEEDDAPEDVIQDAIDLFPGDDDDE